MNRRAFVGAVASGCLLASARGVASQGTGRVYRVGVLSPGSPSTGIGAFGSGIRRLGWAPGQNLIIEQRYARGDLGRLPALAAELVTLNAMHVLHTAGVPPSSGRIILPTIGCITNRSVAPERSVSA